MKILAKIKKRPYILSILFALLLIGIVYAAEYYQVNSGAQVTINEWSVCQKVTNNNALAIFVPTKTAAEWTAFRTYASGVTYASCCSANGVACSSDGNCCSAICGTNADGDAYFSLAAGHTGTCQATSKPYTDCNDSCSTCYPGSTSYTLSADGLDQDCDSVIDEVSATICTPVYGASTQFGMDSSCRFRTTGDYIWIWDDTNINQDLTGCKPSGTSCTSYLYNHKSCTKTSQNHEGWYYPIDCGSYRWAKSLGEGSVNTSYTHHCIPMTGCTKTYQYQ